MLIKKMHVEGCDMRRTALLRQQHPRCISSIACRISAVRVPAAGQPCGACACRGRHHHPRRASPLAAHTADTVAPRGARARSPVGGGCICTRYSPEPSRRGGLPRTRCRRGCGCGPWARRHSPCCECSSNPLPNLHCCCTAGTAYASTKYSAQCCQTDALTYHVITRGPRHGQTYPTPTLAAEKGATARGSPSELARAPARAPGPPRSRHARRGPHARAPTSASRC
jgi:hypothetical protein